MVGGRLLAGGGRRSVDPLIQTKQEHGHKGFIFERIHRVTDGVTRFTKSAAKDVACELAIRAAIMRIARQGQSNGRSGESDGGIR